MGAQLLERTEPPKTTTLPRHDLVRLALLLGWLLLFVGVLSLGDRRVPLSRLDGAVASGQVHDIRVSPALRGEGNIVQEVHWREGWRRYLVRVDLVTPGVRAGNPLPAVHQDLAVRLRAEEPSLHVTRVGELRPSTSVLGRVVPEWVDRVRLALGLAALVLLLGGPRPLRATRWAWFWLVAASGLPTYGLVAFLALSGGTPLVSSPRPGARRLRGGWALLIALVVAAVSSG